MAVTSQPTMFSKRGRSRSMRTASSLGFEGIAGFVVELPSAQLARRIKEIIMAAGKWSEYA